MGRLNFGNGIMISASDGNVFSICCTNCGRKKVRRGSMGKRKVAIFGNGGLLLVCSAELALVLCV